jgi:hypothetical protein
VLVLHNAVRKSRVPTAVENSGKSLNLLKSRPGKSLETDKVLESPGIFFQ